MALTFRGETDYESGKPFRTTAVSVATHVGPPGGVGEICHVVLDHGGQLNFVEGQYLMAIAHPEDSADYSSFFRCRIGIASFSIASSRDGDSSDGKTLSLCVRRAELTPEDVSNFLCNVKKGDAVDIIGPCGDIMVFPEDPKAKHIMVATATGVAPFRSNMHRLFVDPKSTGKFNGLAWLISGADNYNSLLYNEEFTKILKDNPDHFRYQRVLDNSLPDSIYENGDAIFTLLNGGAYIYFAGSMSMMPGIMETFKKIAKERGVEWPKMLCELKKTNRWRVEVY